jgi:TPR repeat protein
MLARIVVLALVSASPSATADSCKTVDEQKKCATACDAKQYDQCASLGLAYINTGDPAALPRGLALLEKACSGNSALGCGGLGSLYMGGVGVPRDVPRALKLFEGACKRGEGISCESLGGYYGQGGGGDPADLKGAMVRAAPYYDRACTLGRAVACTLLATFILEGVKFPGSDRKRIVGLFDSGCRGEMNIACKFLGDIYNKGELVRRDVKKANELYAKSCKLGYDRGCSAKAE